MTRPCLALLLLAAACDDAPADPDRAPEVPAGTRCEPVADWPDARAEALLLAEINDLRARGGRCGELNYLPAAPLRAAPALRCAARLHSQDMHLRQYLGQVDPDGRGTGARLDDVEYRASTYAENVGFAALDPDADIDRMATAAADIAATWADNPLSCWKLRAGELEEIGVGAYVGGYTSKDAAPVPGYYFTAIFAAP